MRLLMFPLCTMSLSHGDVGMVASDDGDTAAYLRATSRGAPLPVSALLPILAIEDLIVAGGCNNAAYLRATSQVVPLAFLAAEEDFQVVLVVYVGDSAVFADSTNVSF